MGSGAFLVETCRQLGAKGYHYQYVFALNAGHVERNARNQTLPLALEWVWKGYPIVRSR